MMEYLQLQQNSQRIICPPQKTIRKLDGTKRITSQPLSLIKEVSVASSQQQSAMKIPVPATTMEFSQDLSVEKASRHKQRTGVESNKRKVEEHARCLALVESCFH